MDDRHRELFTALPDLLGSFDMLDGARKLLSGLSEAQRALDELEQLSGAVKDRCVGQELRYDLCELTGYGYHAGVVFAAYSADFGRAVARGGRYEAIGEAFGRARPRPDSISTCGACPVPLCVRHRRLGAGAQRLFRRPTRCAVAGNDSASSAG